MPRSHQVLAIVRGILLLRLLRFEPLRLRVFLDTSFTLTASDEGEGLKLTNLTCSLGVGLRFSGASY